MEKCRNIIGIFFVNTSQKEQARNACPALFGRATHEAHPAPHAKGVSGFGPHSPLEDRQARKTGAERANIRTECEIPGLTPRRFYAILKPTN